MPKVFIINKGGHDFSEAEKFGDLHYLSQGLVSPFAVDKIYREFSMHLRNSKAEDYILITGLSIMSSIACSCFTHKHRGRLNLLLFKNGSYISRTIMIDKLIDQEVVL